MFKLLPILVLVLMATGSGISYSFDGTIKNEKGQTIYNLRDSQHKIEILDKRGFVQGWVDKNHFFSIHLSESNQSDTSLDGIDVL